MNAFELGQAWQHGYLVGDRAWPAQDRVEEGGAVGAIGRQPGLCVLLKQTVELETVIQPSEILQREVGVVHVIRQGGVVFGTLFLYFDVIKSRSVHWP